MKIDIEKYELLQNGSHRYADWDPILLRTFGKTEYSYRGGGILYTPRQPYGRELPSRHVFTITFNEDGISVNITGREDDKTIRVWELKAVVKYVSDFYKRLYDNGFLTGGN